MTQAEKHNSENHDRLLRELVENELDVDGIHATTPVSTPYSTASSTMYSHSKMAPDNGVMQDRSTM